MQKGNSKYASLSAREVRFLQIARLKQQFELAEESVLAEKVAILTGQAIEEYERERNTIRVNPGEVVVEQDKRKLSLPLLPPKWARKINEGLSVSAVRRHIEYAQWQTLRSVYPEATMEDIWELLNQAELIQGRMPKGFHFLPEKPLDIETLTIRHLYSIEEDIAPTALDKVVTILVEQYGCRPSQAEAMVQTAAEPYLHCCPKIQHLKHGQLVWMAYDTETKGRQDRKRPIRPVLLTLLAPSDYDISLKHRGNLMQLKMKQLERITAEAWIQDAVLTQLDLEWLLNIQPIMVKKLIDAYLNEYGVILPTAGTVLDMGRTLTHKRVIVELFLDGKTTSDIAHRVFHSEVSVDNYISVFTGILLLHYHGVPLPAMMRSTGRSRSLLKEHLALADKHFPTQEALAEYLNEQGVSEEELTKGA